MNYYLPLAVLLVNYYGFLGVLRANCTMNYKGLWPPQSKRVKST